MGVYALPNTMKLLKSQARKAALTRGHKLSRFQALHSQTAVADCTNPKCFANVYCKTNPLPNDADVTGLAVSVNCGGDSCTYK